MKEGWARHLARTGVTRIDVHSSFGKPEAYGTFGRIIRSLKDNIKKDIGWEGENWKFHMNGVEFLEQFSVC
jgi:hypothetical protein